MRHISVLSALSVVLAACVTAKNAPPLPDSALAAHKVAFPSGDGTPLAGYLYRPRGTGPFAAVIMMHGCAGLLDRDGRLRAREAAWLDILRREGYVVLLVDSFGSRGWRNICRIRKRPVLPERERPHDAFGALRWLQNRPFVDADRIALMGWSNGAMAMLWTVRADAPQRPADLAHDFRVAVGFYPGCVRLARTAFRARIPTLLQVGLADDWTPAQPCLALVERSNAAGGAPMEIDAYPGAYHAFDHPAMPVRTVTTRNSALKGGRRRVHIGTDAAARAKAIARVRNWLARALGKQERITPRGQEAP